MLIVHLQLSELLNAWESLKKGDMQTWMHSPTSKSRNKGIGVISARCRTASSHDECSHPYVVDLNFSIRDGDLEFRPKLNGMSQLKYGYLAFQHENQFMAVFWPLVSKPVYHISASIDKLHLKERFASSCINAQFSDGRNAFPSFPYNPYMVWILSMSLYGHFSSGRRIFDQCWQKVCLKTVEKINFAPFLINQKMVGVFTPSEKY